MRSDRALCRAECAVCAASCSESSSPSATCSAVILFWGRRDLGHHSACGVCVCVLGYSSILYRVGGGESHNSECWSFFRYTRSANSSILILAVKKSVGMFDVDEPNESPPGISPGDEGRCPRAPIFSPAFGLVCFVLPLKTACPDVAHVDCPWPSAQPRAFFGALRSAYMNNVRTTRSVAGGRPRAPECRPATAPSCTCPMSACPTSVQFAWTTRPSRTPLQSAGTVSCAQARDFVFFCGFFFERHTHTHTQTPVVCFSRYSCLQTAGKSATPSQISCAATREKKYLHSTTSGCSTASSQTATSAEPSSSTRSDPLHPSSFIRAYSSCSSTSSRCCRSFVGDWPV